ncbi:MULTISPECIES: hypothetical protein [Pseudomonas]|uniref:Colicin V synthesis protein n=1 Tax=Pseudomonas chlororaphis TaxID=587753 RepID=A0A0D5XVV6_9PSED|nr:MULTISPECIES: hypothetical protein [Pseudomonas]AKA22970.1 hypothetical protein PCL1606_15150 [Pseudomonas chlororaphis]
MKELTSSEIEAVSGALSLQESIAGSAIGAIGGSWVGAIAGGKFGANAGGWIVGGISAGVGMLYGTVLGGLGGLIGGAFVGPDRAVDIAIEAGRILFGRSKA